MNIHKRDFYFIRHGETIHNAKQILADADVSINENGIKQAHQIKDIISGLPVKTVCFSPLKRAKETKEIVTRDLVCLKHEIQNLRECPGYIWTQMMHLEKNPLLPLLPDLEGFFNQTLSGVNQALEHPGPVLMIGHGGLHWAMCHLMGIEGEKKIDNCVLVHFYVTQTGEWQRRILVEQTLTA